MVTLNILNRGAASHFFWSKAMLATKRFHKSRELDTRSSQAPCDLRNFLRWLLRAWSVASEGLDLWAWLGLLLFSSSILRQLQLPPSSAVVCWFSSTCCLASALRLPQRRAASRRRRLRFMEHAAVLAESFVALADLLLRSQPPPQGYSLTMLYPWVVRCRRIGVEASGRGRAVPQGRL